MSDSPSFLPLSCELLIKSSLVLLAASAIAWAFRRASAAKRHALWCVAISAIVLLPGTLIIHPRWSMKLPAVGDVAQTPASAQNEFSAGGDDIVRAQKPVAKPWWQLDLPDWRQALGALWVTGGSLILLERALGAARLSKLKRSSPAGSDPRVKAMAQLIIGEMGIRRPVQLRISGHAQVPMTWGTFRPVLLLPAAALGWSDSHLAAALRHEAAHIARADHFTSLIARFALAIYWPNPLVWFAARALLTAQEQAADDLVLAAGASPAQYASQLLEAARSLVSARLASHAAAMARPSTLEQRLVAILDDRRQRKPLTARGLAGAIFSLLLALGLSTSARLFAEESGSGRVGHEKNEQPPRVLVKIASYEVRLKTSEPLLNFSTSTATGASTISPAHFQAALQELKGKQPHRVSASEYTSHSGQTGIITSGSYCRYVEKWVKEGKNSRPGQYRTLLVGDTLKITPTVGPKGKITLEVIETSNSEPRFRDPENSSLAPITTKEALKAKRPLDPLITTRYVKTQVSVVPGETLVLSGSRFGSDELHAEDRPRKHVIYFVTPELVGRPSPIRASAPAS